MKKTDSTWIKFATKQKLRLKADGCGEQIAAGKLGQIYEYSDNEGELVIGAMFMPKVPRKGFAHFLEKLTALGAVLAQRGDMEGTVTFLATNLKALQTACKLLKVPNKRTLSPERRAALTAQLATARTRL